MKIVRLTPDYLFGLFDCGEPDLNDFLLADAKEYASRLLAVTYIIEENHKIAAFFSLSNDRTGCCFITVDALPSAVGFYEHNGFLLLRKSDKGNTETIPMYFNLTRLT